ncbi:hypothetical protein RB195_014606 [Necator americanus]|uniref:Unspecific monooxygenase n=1 Tax=Necator americanus TaxID=51031 RepID=A0ABR1E0X2_NECAM
MFLIIALFVLSVAIFYIWRFYENVKRYPKGPTPIPIFGNLFSTNFRKLHEQLTDFSKVYGNVFTVWIPKPTVVVTDYEGIKEAFAKKGDDFSGRTGIFPDTIFQNVENGGVIFSQDDNWKEQRRISLHILRDFGMGKNLMEEQVLLSAQEFIAHMASMKNKEAVDMRHPIQVFVANIINKTLFGFSYEYNRSERLMAFVDRFTSLIDCIKDSKITFFAQLFPVIYRLPIVGYYSCGRFQQSVDKLKISIREDVERCLKSYNVDEEPECFAQAYCQKMQSNPELNYDNLLNVCMDFFLAGMETTSTTLRWSTLFLANDTRVQDKIRAEILSVVGRDGKPSTSYRNRMPYTCAAIQEIQRCANIVPINVLHRTIKDTSVGSVAIPADTIVIGHIQHVMAHSPVFKNPDEFRPERFLMDDGVTSNKEVVEQLCPFSIGKRQCAGEGLAKVELFIGLVTLLQNYKFEPSKGRTIDLEPICAGVLLPKQQPLRVTQL